MENDSIRSVGSDTLVDIWIDDKMRSLLVSPEAIGAFLGFDKAAGMSDRPPGTGQRPTPVLRVASH